jgi:hypothetical protein
MRPLVLVALLAACAARYRAPTTPLDYDCGDHQLIREGEFLSGAPIGRLQLTPQDDGLVGSTGDRTYEVPFDPREDAVEHVIARERRGQQVCRVRGGYTDMLVRWLGGESIDQLAHEETGGDRDAAYARIRQGMFRQQSRLRREY